MRSRLNNHCSSFVCRDLRSHLWVLWQPRQQEGKNESVPEVQNNKNKLLERENKKEHIEETCSVPPADSQGLKSASAQSVILCCGGLCFVE